MGKAWRQGGRAFPDHFRYKVENRHSTFDRFLPAKIQLDQGQNSLPINHLIPKLRDPDPIRHSAAIYCQQGDRLFLRLR